jgi:hypothetical protein
MMVQQDGHSAPLGLAKSQTEVRILGGVAETTTTMTFTNPMARAMEGDLYFPLPEGATISGYALDINGAMVDGVAVEKHEARQIFEEVVRHGIDPGLVQWTKGNNFQTRVFPIPANGGRTVRVAYVSELIGGKEAPAYHLPLKFKDKVHEFSLRVEVVKPAAPPKVAKGELANFAFEKWHESYVAETRQQDWLPIEDLVIALPKVDGPQVVVEKAEDGTTYFAVQDFPTMPSGALVLQRQPRHMVIFWDASGSRSASDHKREIALVRAYFQQWMGATEYALPLIHIDLVLLRNKASKPQRIELKGSDPAALVAALEKVQYDGGTQLGAIGPIAGTEKPDLYLIFTDGISNFGRDDPAPLDAPAYVFTADAGADHAFLQSLAMSSGGRYFNLANWKDADVLAAIGRPAWSFLSAAIEPGKVTEVYPQLPQPVSGRFTLVGKLVASSMGGLGYGVPGKVAVTSFSVSRADAVEGSLLRRLWAQKKLAHLMIHQKANEKEIAALGKQYGLVTPYTSLLVLDSLEQYVQYEIAPPKSLPAMREEYMRRIDTVEHQKQKEKADKLAQVVRMWEERVKWWNAEFKYAKDFKYKEQDGAKPGMLGGMAAPATAAAPALHFESDARRPAQQEQARGPAPLAPAASAPAAPAPAAPRLEPPLAESLQAAREMPHPAAAASPATAAPAVHAPLADAARRLAGEGERKADERQSGQSYGRQAGIVIKPWQPDMPYLKELQAAKGTTDLFAVYMKNRAQNGTSPGFFLDCADFFREQGASALALQVLSNIAELELEDAALLRVLGHRLLQIGQLDLAVLTFEQVRELRPEEPQSYRDLALALTRRAEETGKRLADEQIPKGYMHPKVKLWNGEPYVFDATVPADPRADYARAIDLLAHVVMGRWDARFPEIEVIALEEVNHIIPRAKAAGVSFVPLTQNDLCCRATGLLVAVQ